MDAQIEGLVTLIDQAIGLAEERVNAKLAGQSDPASIAGLKQIISGLNYRRQEAIDTGFKISDRDTSLGLVRAALEYDVPDSELLNKIDEVERYFTQHYVRKRTI